MLELSTAVAVAGFSFATSATPGPNTLMLASSGANYGVNKTLPHMFGVNIGILLLLLAVAAGIGEIFIAYPQLQVLLKYFAAVYLGYLAWKLISCNHGLETEIKSRNGPPSFWQGIALQWLNPKVWMMAVVSMTVFPTAEGGYVLSAIMVALVMTLVNLPSIALWTVGGSMVGKFLTNERRYRIFNIVMAILLVAATIMICME